MVNSVLLLFFFFTLTITTNIFSPTTCRATLTLPHYHHHPNPEAVVHDVLRSINGSISRTKLQSNDCETGNPIDDCWRCDPGGWQNNRQRLADCAIGFGRNAAGGKGGEIYVVTDHSDDDAVDPKPGTLRYGAVQEEPLWITFASDMTIELSQELLVSNFKTIDGRGAVVHIVRGSVTLRDTNNIIIHNVFIHDAVPTGNTLVRSNSSYVGHHAKTDGDGVTVSGSRDVWIDHCTLWRCTDGLIDVVEGSTAVTVSNCHFSHHDKVMLLGHADDFEIDKGLQVTVAFNVFGEELVQRMPRCRFGFFHIVNNDYTGWGMYAIGGSASPTINSQGNRYCAPDSASSKEVTSHMDKEKNWKNWNWRSQGDVMLNGAFFVQTGSALNDIYRPTLSMEPMCSSLIDQLTLNAGAIMPSSNAIIGKTLPGAAPATCGSGSNDGGSNDGSSNNNNGDPYGYYYYSSSNVMPRLWPSSIIVVQMLLCSLVIWCITRGPSLAMF